MAESKHTAKHVPAAKRFTRIEERCKQDPDAITSTTNLYGDYAIWAEKEVGKFQFSVLAVLAPYSWRSSSPSLSGCWRQSASPAGFFEMRFEPMLKAKCVVVLPWCCPKNLNVKGQKTAHKF